MVYIPGTNIAKGQFAWVDRTGEVERLEQFKAATYTRFDLSSDGERIAVSIAGNRPDIEILDIKRLFNQVDYTRNQLVAGLES